MSTFFSSRSPLNSEEDAVRRNWLYWFGAVGLFAMVLMSGLCNFIRFPLVVFIGALLLLWPLGRGIRWFWYWALDSHHEEWNGTYYEFDGRQIRIFFDTADQIWISAADVFDVFDVKGFARDTQRVRNITGRDGLAPAPEVRLLCFTEQGIAAWLERRTERRASMFDRWLKTQVIAPYRRRMELEQHAQSKRPCV